MGVTQGGAGAFGIFFDNHHRRGALFKCLTYPRVWPMVPFVAWVLYATWYFEGAQELFVGLALFQGVARRRRHARITLGQAHVVVRHLARRVRGVVSHRSHIRGGVFLFSQV